MKAIKMTFSTLSLLILIVCFTTAAPMVQQQKKTPSDETTTQITPPAKSGKKLNFIQKFILKKVGKKMKRIPNEDKYRTWAELSIISGVFAILPIVGLLFMLLSMILGAKANKKSQDKKTKKIARTGFLLGMLFFAFGIGLIIHWLSSAPIGASWGSWGW